MHTQTSRHLVSALTRLRNGFPDDKFVIVGDFNAHNEDWLCSNSGNDETGRRVEAFAQTFGFFQFIDFPTHKDSGNALYLILSDVGGCATCTAPLGTSDHFSVNFTIHAYAEIPDVVIEHSSLDWKRAP